MISRLVSSVVGFCAMLVLVAAPASAVPYAGSLSDRNSTVSFDSSAGLTSWVVDTIPQMKLQWFYYRLDGMTQEMALGDGSLGFVKAKPGDADYDTGDETLNAIYGSEAGFSAALTYVLSGGLTGSRQSDLQETISFTNRTSQAVHLQFYQYVDFDLNGTPDGDTVQTLNANTVRQSDGTVSVAETVVTPAPLHTEVGVYSATLATLTDTKADNLNDSTGPAGPADVTWAFQWDVTVAPGSTVQISKDKNIVPEPATLGLMGLGLVAAVVTRVRKAKRQVA